MDARSQTTVTSPTTGGAVGPIDGTWTVAAGSEAGYRVQEILFGQRATAVGRTNDVTGTMTPARASPPAGFTVDLTTVTSDEPVVTGAFAAAS